MPIRRIEPALVVDGRPGGLLVGLIRVLPEMDAMTESARSAGSDGLLAQAEMILRQIEGSGRGDLNHSELSSVVNILSRLCERVRMLEQERASSIASEQQIHHDFRESIDELIRVQELSGTISSSLDLNAILDSLSKLTRQIVPYKDFGVFRISEADEDLSPLSVQATTKKFVEQIQRLWREKVVDWTIQKGHPTIIDLASVEEEGYAGGGSLVIAPMLGVEGSNAFFVLACDKPQEDFTAGELDLIAILSKQAAIALDNASLYENLADTNRKLRESQGQLVQAGKLAAVGQLAGGVAHEVNNPLQIILSRVQLLMIRHSQVPRLQDDLKLIESNVRRISKIIRSLLDFARYNSGEMEWADEDVAHLARQTCTLVQHQFEKADISLIIKAPRGLSKVYGNAGEIEQVFLNLLLNAQHAMPSGGRITIGMKEDLGYLVVKVSDTGVGIPDDLLPKIFEPFFTTRGSEGGTGLGLSIIHGIVQKHRGRIEVESQPGKGTTFTVYLPPSEKRLKPESDLRPRSPQFPDE